MLKIIPVALSLALTAGAAVVSQSSLQLNNNVFSQANLQAHANALTQTSGHENNVNFQEDGFVSIVH